MSSAAQRLREELRTTGGTQQARSQRDSAVAMYADQVEQFSAVENGLCFGRLDGDDDSRRYIGRIGIFDTSGDYDPLLMDWRAPAARAVLPRHRRQPAGRTAAPAPAHPAAQGDGLNDEVLDLEHRLPHRARGADRGGVAARRAQRRAAPAGCATSSRPSRPSRTRSSAPTCPGVMVVQGGPGTGKTAVALHRAAYLLYTHRSELSSRGVLLVGPNATFLRYISQVLPGAGRDRRAAAYPRGPLSRGQRPAGGAGRRPRRSRAGR